MASPARPSSPQTPLVSLARLAGARRSAFFIALAYFVIVGAAGLVFHTAGDLASESDFFDSYVVQARSFLHGTVAVDPYRGPVYPLLLALFSLPMRLFGAGLFEAGIVLSVLCGALTLFLTQRMLTRWLPASVATAAVLLTALNWVFVRYSYTAGNDMAFTALATGALYVYFRPGTGGLARALVTGVLCGVTYLTRYNGVALPVVMVACILLVDVWRISWARRALVCVLLVAGFAATLSPWALYCKAETGRYFYNENYLNVAYGAYMTTEKTTEEFLAHHSFDGFRDVIQYDTARLVGQLGRHFVEHTQHVMRRVFSWPLSVFMVVGLAALFFRPRRRELVAYALIALVFYVLLLMVFYSDRFMLFLVPVACAFAAHGFVVACRLVRRRVNAPTLDDFLVTTLLIYSAITCVAFNRPVIHGGDSVFREMGEAFAHEHPDHDPTQTVVARKAYFGYFAGLRTAPLPLFSSHDELMAYLRRVHADYLFFSYVAVNTRPDLYYLSNTNVPHPGLVLVALSPPTAAGGFRGVLYRVEPESAPTDN